MPERPNLPPDLVAARDIPDLPTRAQQVYALAVQYRDWAAAASRIVRRTLDELQRQEGGYPQRAMADLLGVSQSRISRIMSARARPESVLLGNPDKGAIVVVAGGKRETGRTNPSVFLSREVVQARDIIANLCATYEFDADLEVVGPPGLIRLNRDNLIVLTSPRLLPLVGQMLEADPFLYFDHSERGWYLVDRATNTTYRSPSDTGEASDYAYLGRVPRPDGRGTFLYLAGIHAMGTLGAAQYLADNLPALFKQTRGSRWSMLVRVDYDQDTHSVERTTPVTPVYQHEGG